MSLKIKRHISSQDWMCSPQTNRVFDALQGDTAAELPQALFVGGCVRNLLLGQAVEDIDLATPLPPDTVMDRLKRADISVIPTGLKHGTVTAVLDGIHYEITTLRRDEETDGRRAQVAFTDSWGEDAQRRDFTINALFMDRQGGVYDPTGQGLADVESKRVRFIGDAAKRIEEDHLRILRFFRFSALYSSGYDEDGLRACQAAADKIGTLSRERITQEFFKILASDRPRSVLDVMFEHNVLRDLHCPGYDPDMLEHLCHFQKQYRLGALSSRLYVFAGLSVENVQQIGSTILFPKVFIKDMMAIKGALTLSDLSCDHAVYTSIYRFGRNATAQALLIELVQDRVMNRYAPQALALVQNWDIPDFPVTGQDLKAQGIPEGPEMGRILSALEDQWIENGFCLPDDCPYA